MSLVQRWICRCDQCGKEWLPESSVEPGSGVPAQCARCKSRNWNLGEVKDGSNGVRVRGSVEGGKEGRVGAAVRGAHEATGSPSKSGTVDRGAREDRGVERAGDKKDQRVDVKCPTCGEPTKDYGNAVVCGKGHKTFK